jgi:hypothetical protein
VKGITGCAVAPIQTTHKQIKSRKRYNGSLVSFKCTGLALCAAQVFACGNNLLTGYSPQHFLEEKDILSYAFAVVIKREIAFHSC